MLTSSWKLAGLIFSAQIDQHTRFHSLGNHTMSYFGVCLFRPMASCPHQVRPHIDSSSDQVLQIYLSHTEKKKRQYYAHDETKHVYFSFFNPLKVTDELEIKVYHEFMGANSPWGETGLNPYI